MEPIDAIRFIPNSFDPHQGRIPGGGFQGNDYAISLLKTDFNTYPEAETALTHPYTWIVLDA